MKYILLACTVTLKYELFNMYTNDQPIHDGTRNFIYTDDLCVTALYSSFTEVETAIGDALEELTQYYRSNSLRADPDKRQVTAFLLRNKEANRSLMEQDKTGEYPTPEVPRCYSWSHAKLQGAHTQYQDEGGHPQQSTKKVVQFEMWSKRKYHKKSSIGIMLLCGWVRSTSLSEIISCQETEMRGKMENTSLMTRWRWLKHELKLFNYLTNR